MKYASPDVKVFFGAGSPMEDITEWCTGPIPIEKNGIVVDVTPYGATAVKKMSIGISDDPDIVIEGIFDDKVDGPHEAFKAISGAGTAAYTILVTFGTGSPLTSATKTVHIGTYAVLPSVKDVVRFRATLVSDTEWVWS